MEILNLSKNRTKDNLLSAEACNDINDWSLPGSTIVSDWWRAYDYLENEGFLHRRVNHLYNFVDSAKRLGALDHNRTRMEKCVS